MGETPAASGSDVGGRRSERGTAHRPENVEESLVGSGDLTEWLRERFGDDLRTVLVYEGTTTEYTHLDDGVGEQYSDGELERIADETAFRDGLTQPHYESLFHLGDTEATVTLFEDATLVQVPFDDATGVVLTVERGRSVDVGGVVSALRGEYRPEFVSAE